MRVAYTDKNGRDAVIEVSNIFQLDTTSIQVGALVFKLRNATIHSCITRALREGYLDLRPISPVTVIENEVEYEGD